MDRFILDIAVLLLALLLAVCIAVGHILGRKHLDRERADKLLIVGVAESAVFGLLALLIAFTFSGAYERYESRKMHLVEEADVFDRAYNYIDLLPNNMQAEMRQDMRDYFDTYIAIFSDIPDVAAINKHLVQAHIIEDKIWHATVRSVDESKNKALAQVYIPVFNDMFEAAHTGYYMTQIHPPSIIFVLLIGLSALGAFLVGYNSAEMKRMWPLHSICYVLLTAITIYIIVNMEYPRVGFIDLGVFDKILTQVRMEMS
ncbi:MAG TPA: hypothetical protein VLG38_04175 [Gammaproteobacteria bacterium]|nr:hypothetical protein [Gammaproteobacteria bacterium]